VTSRNPTVSKIAKRLRKAHEITYQATVEGISDDKVIRRYPRIVNEAIDAIILQLNIIKDQAKLVEKSQDRKEERNEIMVGVTQELANLSTIMGGSGDSLKVLTHSDHNYIRGVILLSAEEAWIRAVKDMNESERLQFENRLNQVGYSVEMEEE
jgi:hypothetical protein